MNQAPKLSVIMPLFNVEDTVSLALDSILMQNVNFDYEIIAVDDFSSDSTLQILKEYSFKYPYIKIIEHKENQGNAISFYDALCVAKGDYFCVLDGDDFYTVKNKLQKQVDFLDSDKKRAYVAVTHKYLKINNEGKIWKYNHLTNRECQHTYKDFLKQNFYYHTSAYMYRNVFRGNVPEVFKEELMRGDNPRTFMCTSYTKSKIKHLDFVGSVYRYSSKGIWSKTTPEAQHARNIKMYEYLGEMLKSQKEKDIWFKICEKRRTQIAEQPNEASWLDDIKLIEDEILFSKMRKMEFFKSFFDSLDFIDANIGGKSKTDISYKIVYCNKPYLIKARIFKNIFQNMLKSIFLIAKTQDNSRIIINILGVKIRIKI